MRLALPGRLSPAGQICQGQPKTAPFLDFPGDVEVTNDACELALRPSVIPHKITIAFRALWACPLRLSCEVGHRHREAQWSFSMDDDQPNSGLNRPLSKTGSEQLHHRLTFGSRPGSDICSC
jgi:hypothetical protein